MKILTIALFAALQFVMFGCSKKSIDGSIEGVWVIEHPLGYDISGIPVDTLIFRRKCNTNVMILNMKGAAPSNPDYIETPYRYLKSKLEFINYRDTASGYIPANSFKWVTEGSKFEVNLCEVNLYMNACDKVFYNKIGSTTGRL